MSDDSGSAPEVRWKMSPHDLRCHALTPEQADAAATRGWADALCGMTLPVGHDFDSHTTEAPQPPLCWPCIVEYTSDLPDPGRFGTTGLSM